MAERSCEFESHPAHNHFAEIAQLVEHDLAKVGVAGSSPVFRSRKSLVQNARSAFFFSELYRCPNGGIGRRARFRCECLTTCRFESCFGHYIAEGSIMRKELLHRMFGCCIKPLRRW